MEFSRIGNELEIRLSARDTQKLGFDFASFDLENKQNREVLWELLEAGREQTGFSVERSRLVVHLRARAGGEVSFFCRAREGEESLYRFSDFDALCLARRFGVLPRGRLYRKEEVFFLLTQEAPPTLSEYADSVETGHKMSVLENAIPCHNNWTLKGETDDGTTETRVQRLPKMPPT